MKIARKQIEALQKLAKRLARSAIKKAVKK